MYTRAIARKLRDRPPGLHFTGHYGRIYLRVMSVSVSI